MVELDQPRSTDVMGGDFMWTTSAEKKREGKNTRRTARWGTAKQFGLFRERETKRYKFHCLKLA